MSIRINGGGSLPADNVTGTGVNTQIAYFTGAHTVEGDADFTWNKTSNLLTIQGDIIFTNIIFPSIDAPANVLYLGDGSGFGNGNFLSIDDNTGSFFFNGVTDIKFRNIANTRGGDIKIPSSFGNGFELTNLETSGKVYFSNDNGGTIGFQPTSDVNIAANMTYGSGSGTNLCRFGFTAGYGGALFVGSGDNNLYIYGVNQTAINGSPYTGLTIDNANGYFAIGDTQGSVNGTYISVDDSATTINILASEVHNYGTNYFSALSTNGYVKTTGSNGQLIVAPQTFGRFTGQTAAKATVAQYTPPADGSYMISANVLVTTATLHNFTVTVLYSDETTTVRTVTLQFSTLAGAFVTAITNAQGTVPYEGVPLHIRAKGGNVITISTTGTFTTVVYNVEGNIVPIQ